MEEINSCGDEVKDIDEYASFSDDLIVMFDSLKNVSDMEGETIGLVLMDDGVKTCVNFTCNKIDFL
jgi:hypothetical protein